MNFIKMQACGNDYIYFDCRKDSSVYDKAAAPDWISKICDRHFGIGADGIVLLDDVDGLRMTMYNADGSRGKTCGNALRSLALYLDCVDQAAFPLHIRTDVGHAKIEKKSEGLYRVAMGRARMTGMAVTDDGTPYHIVDVGNLHSVCFGREQDVVQLAERVHRHYGLGDLNVEQYSERGERRLAMQVCEIGTGHTLGCGSGACAVAFDACYRGICTYGLPIVIEMEGGTVEVECHKNGAVWLTGDAAIVFEGNIDD